METYNWDFNYGLPGFPSYLKTYNYKHSKNFQLIDLNLDIINSIWVNYLRKPINISK